MSLLDCDFIDCDVWTDITRGVLPDWIRGQMEDHSHDRQLNWNRMHPSRVLGTLRWIGEVDYTGPCDHANDLDCDHWWDSSDNCPLLANTDQIDSNDDGVGDACKNCPCDTNVDVDGDTICDAPCRPTKAGQALDHYPAACVNQDERLVIDNCPYVFNEGQANCNGDSEMARSSAVLGDACDPVPCAPTTADANDPLPTQPACSGNAGVFLSCRGRHIHDLLRTRTIGAHSADYRSVNLVEPPYGGETVSFVESSARFCQSKPSAGFFCDARAAITDQQLNAFPALADERLDAARPCQRFRSEHRS